MIPPMAESMKERLIKKFEDEIHALDRELKLELPKEIKRARELGDLRENAEYHAAKERQRLVESRISLLQKRVSEIALINVDRIPTDRAGFGSTLHVVESTGEKLVFQLVMPEDADAAKGMISTTSPIGRAFLNKEEGDTREGGHAGRHARVRDRQAADHPQRSHEPMTGRSDAPPSPSAEPYSPQLRTALVLTGTGTAGAYHAGVLRALHEAGVKLDVVAGRGIGVVGALFAAIDGAQRLWEREGFLAGAGVAVALSLACRGAGDRLGARASPSAIVAIPLAVMVAGLIVFPLDFLLRMVGVGGASGSRRRAIFASPQAAFAPDGAADLASAACVSGARRWRRPLPP